LPRLLLLLLLEILMMTLVSVRSEFASILSVKHKMMNTITKSGYGVPRRDKILYWDGGVLLIGLELNRF
jgi:hypothetical protein